MALITLRFDTYEHRTGDQIPTIQVDSAALLESDWKLIRPRLSCGDVMKLEVSPEGETRKADGPRYFDGTHVGRIVAPGRTFEELMAALRENEAEVRAIK